MPLSSRGNEIMKTQELIGTTHNTNHPKDAIHIAVAQVGAGELMKPGDHIGFKNNTSTAYKFEVNTIGIVDPFLKKEVSKGQLFYMFLYPNSIHSLEHNWMHPAFASSEDKKKSKEFLDELLNRDCVMYGDHPQFDDTLERFKKGDVMSCWYGDTVTDFLRSGPEERKKFWDSLEIVTGITATKEQREQDSFSCSC